jgi:hypothetical protein
MEQGNDLIAFNQEVTSAIDLYESLNQHVAINTKNMIAKHGKILALSRLMSTPDAQKGFKVLRDSNQLDRTFEAIVTRYAHLFAADIVDAARWRLEHAYELL